MENTIDLIELRKDIDRTKSTIVTLIDVLQERYPGTQIEIITKNHYETVDDEKILMKLDVNVNVNLY